VNTLGICLFLDADGRDSCAQDMRRQRLSVEYYFLHPICYARGAQRQTYGTGRRIAEV